MISENIKMNKVTSEENTDFEADFGMEPLLNDDESKFNKSIVIL
jgi:hypothetical protein